MAVTLTEEQYLPLAVALEHRRREQGRGLKLLFTPVPACLECGEPPSTIAVDQDHAFMRDLTLVKFSCGHVYEIANRLIFKTSEQVNRIVDAEENRPAGSRTETPPQRPIGAVIEIIERGRTTDDTQGGSIIVPNEVRLNGQPLLASAEDPVIVHQISTRGDDLVRVTLTLFARRVSIRAEHDEA